MSNFVKFQMLNEAEYHRDTEKMFKEYGQVFERDVKKAIRTSIRQARNLMRPYIVRITGIKRGGLRLLQFPRPFVRFTRDTFYASFGWTRDSINPKQFRGFRSSPGGRYSRGRGTRYEYYGQVKKWTTGFTHKTGSFAGKPLFRTKSGRAVSIRAKIYWTDKLNRIGRRLAYEAFFKRYKKIVEARQ